MLKPAIACRLDSESEKITNFFNFDQRITLIARNKAYRSARKMLVRSGSRTLLVMPLYTIAEATRSPALEPSVYNLVDLMAFLLCFSRDCHCSWQVPYQFCTITVCQLALCLMLFCMNPSFHMVILYLSGMLFVSSNNLLAFEFFTAHWGGGRA